MARWMVGTGMSAKIEIQQKYFRDRAGKIHCEPFKTHINQVLRTMLATFWGFGSGFWVSCIQNWSSEKNLKFLSQFWRFWKNGWFYGHTRAYNEHTKLENTGVFSWHTSLSYHATLDFGKRQIKRNKIFENYFWFLKIFPKHFNICRLR